MIAVAAATSLGAMRRSVVRRDSDWSHLVDRLQASAAELVCVVFPEDGLKKFRFLRWFPYHGLSRARNGTNCPLARAAVWMAGMRALGVDRAMAQMLVDWMQDVVIELWPAEEINLIAASDEEQHWEGIETSLQMIVMRQIEAGDTSRIPEYLESSRRERAAQRALEDGLRALAQTLDSSRILSAPASAGGRTR